MENVSTMWQCCVNNVFVKDAIATKQELENQKAHAAQIVEQYQTITSNVVAYGNIEEQYNFLVQIYRWFKMPKM